MPTAMREAVVNGSIEVISLVAQACDGATKKVNHNPSIVLL